MVSVKPSRTWCAMKGSFQEKIPEVQSPAATSTTGAARQPVCGCLRCVGGRRQDVHLASQAGRHCRRHVLCPHVCADSRPFLSQCQQAFWRS